MSKATHIDFHHAIRFREDLCIGCSHCMSICPTEAVRVINGRAHMLPNRCIDCGNCYRVCPAGAIIVEQDDIGMMHRFRARIALVPSVFTGQFPESASVSDIFQAIREAGFTHVMEVEESVPFLLEKYREYISGKKADRPLISSYCPAIVRLIQVKFPTLTPHIIRMKAPVELTALHARQLLTEEGYSAEETGVFYVTPCAAKIVAVKNPVGEKHSAVDGVISMQYLYNKVYKILRERKSRKEKPENHLLPANAIRWSLTHGEASQIGKGRSLAIDEINNVIEFLEKVENEEIDGIDFLELRACDESCAGGILCPGNRFMTADKLRQRAVNAELWHSAAEDPSIPQNTRPVSIPEEQTRTEAVTPRSMLKLDDQVAVAMVRMKRIYELNSILPQVDCGICGSPTCKSLAEDIVRDQATIRQCIFVQKILEQNENLDPAESVQIMRSIWGGNKLDKNSIKSEFPGTN